MKKYSFFFLICLLTTLCFAAGNDSTNRQVSIMSYNIKMLPRGAVFLHHHPVIRAKFIPEQLLRENTDVIVFEEAFDGYAIRILTKKLKSVYPYVQGTKNRKVVSYKKAGGVLIFSKYPMKEIESIKYTQCKGIDCMGNKGAILVEVQHPVQKFQVLGTHMQAGGGPELKKSQYAEAGQLLQRHEQKGVPQFAAGDFNTKKNDPKLYPFLVDALKVQDGDITGDLQFTSDHMLNDMEKTDSTKRRVIDFVFYKNNGTTALSSSRYVKEFQHRWATKHKDLSDHNAIIMYMTF